MPLGAGALHLILALGYAAASMAPLRFLLLLLLLTGCPAAYTATYEGGSDTERELLAEARRDIYPDDVRKDPETFRTTTLAWPGIVMSARPDPSDTGMSEVVIEHHYWDWMEDHSIQKAKAFLSPRGEGAFVCHAERRTVPSIELKTAMAIAYVRPVEIKDQKLHATCIVRFFPRVWYATNVMDYGRNGEGRRFLRVPME
jgi:hypothetical protein